MKRLNHFPTEDDRLRWILVEEIGCPCDDCRDSNQRDDLMKLSLEDLFGRIRTLVHLQEAFEEKGVKTPAAKALKKTVRKLRTKNMQMIFISDPRYREAIFPEV